MSVRIEFEKELDSVLPNLKVGTLADAMIPTRVVINDECVPPEDHGPREEYNDVFSVYMVVRNLTEFLASNDEVVTLTPAFPDDDKQMRLEKLDESRVKIDWEYSYPDFEHTEVVDRNALGSELLATGREYIQFAREVVFPHAEANPDWAGEYGKVYQLDIDREYIDELETHLDDVEKMLADFDE
ncbi:hypothetical protein [Halobacterium jilantaiense]|uniref:Uncharacterized protein n=1 Tax=Halobacterium jilantaiense TaxID=355548 RepID=A0A1I0NP97_9EURY|nr:hypothetical protein [Halobacterium jilantaiense]SEW03292.1 hypothetical protein SAMN04487945_1041 [Halobacterium jilantaiense]